MISIQPTPRSVSQVWTTWRIAGCILLTVPASMILVSFLNQVFHFIPEKGSQSTDIGIILLIWFGISLARGNTKHRLSALFLSALYFILLSAVALFGAFSPSSDSHFNLFVPIVDPQGWHYFLFWLTAFCFFGIPAYLLFKKNNTRLKSCR